MANPSSNPEDPAASTRSATPPPEEDRVLAVLEQWFVALETGEALDLLELCGGDEALAARARRLIADDPLPAGRDPESEGSDPDADFGDAPPHPGDRLGDFRIEHLIGAGGMGRVFYAIQESLGRAVALKVIHTSHATPSLQARFRREGRITAALDHPNIVPVYGVGESDGISWIAMRWLSGPSLDRCAVPLTVERVIAIGIAAAEALAETHAVGVTHRDIKPSNLIYDGEQLFLVDFGLAKGNQEQTQLTAERTIPGTLAYLAPELLSGRGMLPGPRTDLWALGATLFELLTGRPAFDAQSRERLVHDILERDPPSLAKRGVDRDLATIIERCLAKEPHNRFESANQLAEELERRRDGLPIRSRPIGLLGRSRRWVRRNRRFAAVAGTLAVICAGALAWAGWTTVLGEVRRDAQRQLVHQALQSDDLTRASILMGTLDDVQQARGPSALLRRRLAARQAVERLIDQCIDLTTARHSGRLELRMGEVRDSMALSEVPDRAHAALGVGAYLLGRDELAEEHFQAIRDATALRSALLNIARQPPVASPPSAGLNADGAILVACALRARSTSRSLVRPMVEQALRAEPAHYRAHFLIAILDAASDEVEAAQARLAGIARATRPHSARKRVMAQILLQHGDAEGALALIDSVPPSDRDPIALQVRITALRTLNQLEEAERTLDAALNSHPRSGLLATIYAEGLAARGDTHSALDALDRVLAGDAFPEERTLASIARLAIEQQTVSAEAAQSESGRAKLRDLADRAEDLAGDTAWEKAAGSAWLLSSICASRAGEFERAAEKVERAIEGTPEDPRAHAQRIRILYQRARRLFDDPKEKATALGLTRQSARELLRLRGWGAGALQPSERVQALWLCSLLLEAGGQVREAQPVIEALRTLLAQHGGEQRILDYVAAFADRHAELF